MIKCMTPQFRVSFPQVFEAKAMPGQPDSKKKYSLVCLFTLADINANKEEVKRWTEMAAACKAVAAEKWPKGLPQNLQTPFRKGEEKEQFQGYGKGVVFISATTTTRPGLVDASVKPIIAAEEFYAGCYARAMVNPYAWEYMGKRGVSFGLQNIQKLKDGEPFSARSKPEDDFDASTAEDVMSTSDPTMGGIFG